MKVFNFLLGVIAAVSFVACGSDDNGGGAASTPKTTEQNITTLNRGSGGTCPDISGTYSCTEVKEGNNTSTEIITYEMFKNNQGQQILRQDGLNVLMDGNIHDVPGGQVVTFIGGESPKYSVNCSGNTIVVHMVGNDKNASKMTITKDADGHVSGTTYVLEEGVLSTSTGACTIATQEQLNTQPPSEDSGFDLIGWIMGWFF